MHARELMELAALVANHSATLIESPAPISETSIQQYWATSKCRLDRWSRAIREHGSLHDNGAVAPELYWRRVRPVLEEILIGEALTRVWTAVLTLGDRQRGTNEGEPVGRSIYIGHIEARHRALHLMVYGQGINTADAVALNRLRRRTERWTDLLLGYILQEEDLYDLAFDPDRAREFGEDLGREPRSPGARRTWPIVLTSLRAAYKHGLDLNSANGDLNEQIASAVLACFSSELFDSTGIFRSLWQVRLTNTTADTEGLLEDLLSLDSPTDGPARWEPFSSRGGGNASPF